MGNAGVMSEGHIGHLFINKAMSLRMYCYGEGSVKVLMQDYGLLCGVIAFVRTHCMHDDGSLQ